MCIRGMRCIRTCIRNRTWCLNMYHGIIRICRIMVTRSWTILSIGRLRRMRDLSNCVRGILAQSTLRVLLHVPPRIPFESIGTLNLLAAIIVRVFVLAISVTILRINIS